MDVTIWFFVPPDHPTNAIKLKGYCIKLKTKKITLDAMVAYCKINDERLCDMTRTTSNILKHYEINGISFSNFCREVVGSTYVKWTWNTKIKSLSKQAGGFLNRIIHGSTSIQQVDDDFQFSFHFGGPSLLSTLHTLFLVNWN